jgi:hypothetical protein
MRVAGSARSVGAMPAPLNVFIRAFGYAWIGILITKTWRTQRNGPIGYRCRHMR